MRSIFPTKNHKNIIGNIGRVFYFTREKTTRDPIYRISGCNVSYKFFIILLTAERNYLLIFRKLFK